jgi:parallel beta-helix repeat protein
MNRAGYLACGAKGQACILLPSMPDTRHGMQVIAYAILALKLRTEKPVNFIQCLRPLSDNSKLVARLGRKATGQAKPDGRVTEESVEARWRWGSDTGVCLMAKKSMDDANSAGKRFRCVSLLLLTLVLSIVIGESLVYSQFTPLTSPTDLRVSAVATPTTGRVYYVGKTGNNNYGCSQAQNPATPKQTITGSLGGISCLSSGDTLLIRAGIYNETYFNLASGQPNIPGGSSSKMTVIKGEGIGVTIWKPKDGILMKNPNNYIRWQGFTLDCIDMKNATDTCFKEFRQDTGYTVGWHIANLAIVDAPDNAMFFTKYTRNWIIERTELKNPGRMARLTGALYNWIYGQGSGHIMRDNYLYHTRDITPGTAAGGLRVASNAVGDSGPGGNIIERNIIKNVRLGVVIGSNDNNIVRDNTIIDTTLYGIQVWMPTSGTKIDKNSIAGRCSTGIFVGSTAVNTSVTDNTISGCSAPVSDNGVGTVQNQ